MKTIIKYFEDDGQFPNSNLPVVIYKQFRSGSEALRPDTYQQLLDKNNWGDSWINGLYNYHHYHSTAHEVLCIYSGWVDVLLGGENGEIFHAEAGDIIILPAGTAHKNVVQSESFSVIGSYPDGQIPDTKRGKIGERPQVDTNIAKVGIPKLDPLFGLEGDFPAYWNT